LSWIINIIRAKLTKFLELDNDDTEDEQIFITELKDNNEVDYENWEPELIIWSLTRFLYIHIRAKPKINKIYCILDFSNLRIQNFDSKLFKYFEFPNIWTANLSIDFQSLAWPHI
jgi:hypothetical protein